MRIRLNTFLIFTIVYCSFPLKVNASKAVTYETTSGRFGDNLLSYLHAKWISYKYDIPLIYKPFIYSNKLSMDGKYPYYSRKTLKQYKKILEFDHSSIELFKDSSSNLYIIPYFPESKYEKENGISFKGGPWAYIPVDWNDQSFIQEVMKDLLPKEPIFSIQLPVDRINVAIHVRRGGNYDPVSLRSEFPLKFLSEEFFIEQLKNLFSLLKENPLYVYIFTDDTKPMQIVNKIAKNFHGSDIIFDCRSKNNSDTVNVLEDFFSMMQFDCLIHSESNYSLIPSKLVNYLVSIFPDSFCKENGQIIYDHVAVSINQDHEKYVD